jgi:diacylglycerol diphosphate phosphatase/phosphatidate phosphatase
MPRLGPRSRLVLSYGIDWILAIVIALFCLIYLQQFQQIPEFSLTDTSIQFSIKNPQTVSNDLLAIFLAIPYISLVIGHFVFSYRIWSDLHASLLGLSIGYSVSGSIVQFVRILVGRPRPDFIARCEPPPGAVNNQSFGLVNIGICQSNDTAFLIDGMRSFFSGHAILSAMGFGFLSLYLAGKLHIFDGKAYSYKLWFVSAPIIFSIWICLSRIADRRHHWQDVALGFVLGLFFAFVTYRQFYPSLGDAECHIPYSHRTSGWDTTNSGPRLPLHNRPGWRRLFDSDGAPGRSQSNNGNELESLGFMTTPFEAEPNRRDQ